MLKNKRCDVSIFNMSYEATIIIKYNLINIMNWDILVIIFKLTNKKKVAVSEIF